MDQFGRMRVHGGLVSKVSKQLTRIFKFEADNAGGYVSAWQLDK